MAQKINMNRKAHVAGKSTGSVGFLYIWSFCQVIRIFYNQPAKVAMINSSFSTRYSESSVSVILRCSIFQLWETPSTQLATVD